MTPARASRSVGDRGRTSQERLAKQGRHQIVKEEQQSGPKARTRRSRGVNVLMRARTPSSSF